MVVDYKSRKNEVLASYNKVEELVADLQAYSQKIGLSDPAERLGTLLSDIRGKAEKVKEDRFKIVIAGEAKSGKSTFINAYLGVELLPMDVKQCTSAIVEIKYGDVFSVKATYADGRQTEFTGDDEVRDFLKKNAALDDQYRDIPVPTINSEILVKSGSRALAKGAKISIIPREVEEMLESEEVKDANIYGLTPEEYNKRIRAYIEEKKDSWQDIVTKIEIMFPFGEDLRGIEIVDSPGVAARGGVDEITKRYIKKADSVIFLKPIVGQSLESTQFSQFMEDVIDERNKNTLFLVLTHISTKNEADLRRLEEEAEKQFSGKLDKRNILFADSKVELYSKKFADIGKMDDIGKEIDKLDDEGTLDDFVYKAYTKTKARGSGDKEDFIKKLQEKSRFYQIDQSLEEFGRKAHYIRLAALLDSISQLYSKLWNDVNSDIDMYRQKAEDPTELAVKIADVKKDLDILQNKLSRGVDDVVRRFRGDKGIIQKEAEQAVEDFLISAKNIAPDCEDAFIQLEKLSWQKIDQFKGLQERLQEQAVEEFDKELVALSDKSSITYEDVKPDFTEETFEEIKENTVSKASETKEIEEGATFKKSHTYSVYSQLKHFELVKDDILRRLDDLKGDLTSNLEEFVDNIRSQYISELSKNARVKKAKLDAIMEAQKNAEQIRDIIAELVEKSGKLKSAKDETEKIRGGILKYVQHDN